MASPSGEQEQEQAAGAAATGAAAGAATGAGTAAGAGASWARQPTVQREIRGKIPVIVRGRVRGQLARKDLYTFPLLSSMS